MVCTTCGIPKTETERAATHRAIYGTAPPAVRRGRNPYNRQYVSSDEDDMIVGSILFIGGVAAVFAFVEYILPLWMED